MVLALFVAEGEYVCMAAVKAVEASAVMMLVAFIACSLWWWKCGGLFEGLSVMFERREGRD